jgi:hypothetical protein
VVTLAVSVAVFLFVSYVDVSRRQAEGNRGEITVVYIDELMIINVPVIERVEGVVWKTANSNITAKITYREITVKTRMQSDSDNANTEDIQRYKPRECRGPLFQVEDPSSKVSSGSRFTVRLYGEELNVLGGLLVQLIQVR